MWYVIQVGAGNEADIMELCKERVILPSEKVFVPLAEKKIKKSGEERLTTTRLFPGYVFAETEDAESLHERLRAVPKLTKIVKTGDERTAVYPEEEKYLRHILDENHVARLSKAYFDKGDRIRIVNGALKGMEGYVKKVIKHRRLVVLEVPLLKTVTDVTLGYELIDEALDSK